MRPEEASGAQSRDHLRWRSLDVLPEAGGELKNIRKGRRSVDYGCPVNKHSVTPTAEPKVAADVARVFDKMVTVHEKPPYMKWPEADESTGETDEAFFYV